VTLDPIRAADVDFGGKMLTRVINCISDISALEHAEPETAYNNEKNKQLGESNPSRI
jgi:hypothetical protein